MATARELMTAGAECVGENETLVDAARKMRDLNVGALPICGEDEAPQGNSDRPRHRCPLHRGRRRSGQGPRR